MIVNGKVPSTLGEGSRVPIWAYRLAFGRAALASSPCQGMVDAHLRLGIRGGGSWMVIPNIVLDEAFETTPQSRQGALFVGRFMPVKNPWLAAESAAGAGVPLTLLGSGQMQPQLEAQIATLPDPKPEIRTYDPKPWSVFASHRVLVVTSEVESFGNVLVESLAAGTPVVSVDCDFGPREIIAGARYSRLTSRSPAEIGEALLEATQRPYGEDEARECREIADRYRPAAVYPLIEQALERLLARSRG
jgi:glycosyltransferase involved in cell wall biosynthesis